MTGESKFRGVIGDYDTGPNVAATFGVTAYFILPNILSGGIICASIFYPVG